MKTRTSRLKQAADDIKRLAKEVMHPIGIKKVDVFLPHHFKDSSAAQTHASL